MKRMLNFNSSGLKKLHFLAKDINFPVAIAIYSEQEKMKVLCLLDNIKLEKFSTETICKWCVEHQTRYQSIYSLRKKNSIIIYLRLVAALEAWYNILKINFYINI